MLDLSPSLLELLNDDQRRAVLHGTGPALVLAGAGSGKTRVLVHRIAGLIETGIDPTQILALTFTNKAAKEMRERVRDMLSEEGGALAQSSRRVSLTTFHAFGASFLRQHAARLGRSEQFVIYDQNDQKKLLKSVISRMHLDLQNADLLDVMQSIGTAKNQGNWASEAESLRLLHSLKIDVGEIGRKIMLENNW